MMGGNQSKNTPLVCMIKNVKNFKKEFNGDYGIKLTPNKFKVLCEVDWSALGVGWPPEQSLNKTVVNKVYRVIVEKSGHPEQFPYIDCWQDAVLSWPTWLRPYLEEACRILVARVSAASKCREKAKECVLSEEAEEIPPPYVPFYPTLPPVSTSVPPPLTLDSVSHTCKIWFRSFWGLNSPELPESYVLSTHSKSTNAHPVFLIQLRSSDQSL
jgi:hypothetical protein